MFRKGRVWGDIKLSLGQASHHIKEAMEQMEDGDEDDGQML